MIYSANAFFQFGDEYRFDASQLGEAHGGCLSEFSTDLAQHLADPTDPTEVFIVDNTNSTLVEIAPYYALAQAYGHDVVFHLFRGNRHVVEHIWHPRNIHGVPLNACLKIAGRIWNLPESFPPFWKFELRTHFHVDTEFSPPEIIQYPRK